MPDPWNDAGDAALARMKSSLRDRRIYGGETGIAAARAAQVPCANAAPDPTLSAEQLLLSRKEVTPMRKLIIAIAVLSSFLTACATMPIPAKDAPVFFDHQ